MSRPLGIAASFTKVAFKKDGAVVYESSVTTGGCFGPTPGMDDSRVANYAYQNLLNDIEQGRATNAILDFNSVAVRGREYDAVRVEERMDAKNNSSQTVKAILISEKPKA